jgi:hypothetical protein
LKKYILSAIAIAVVAGSVFASDPKNRSKRKIFSTRKINYEHVSLGVINDSKLNLHVRGDKNGQVDVAIYHESGKCLFQEKINYKNSFNLPVDLSNKNEGNYKFVVVGKDVHFEQQVFHSKMYTEDVVVKIKKLNEGIYNVRVLHDKVPVEIKIYNKKGDVFYSKVYKRKANFEQRFNLRYIKGQDLEIAISGQKSYIRKSL